MQANSMLLAGFGNLGMPELLVVLFIGLLLFGRRLPELARSLGLSMSEFKRGLNEGQEQMDKDQRARQFGQSAPPPNLPPSSTPSGTTPSDYNNTR